LPAGPATSTFAGSAGGGSSTVISDAIPGGALRLSAGSPDAPSQPARHSIAANPIENRTFVSPWAIPSRLARQMHVCAHPVSFSKFAALPADS
jgi:hypothetical protein